MEALFALDETPKPQCKPHQPHARPVIEMLADVRLPFRKLAISYEGAHSNLDSLHAWAQHAMFKGADALWLRMRTSRAEIVVAHVQHLRGRGITLPILLGPADDGIQELIRLGIAVQGFHLASASQFQVTGKREYLWGRSCHDFEGISAAYQAGYTYVSLSPVFKTGSHPEARPLGLALFSAIAKASPLPIVALGGIVEGNAPACYTAGAHAVAAINWFRP